MPPTHYETLGVSRKASVVEIKKAFRKLSLETHPDVAGPDQKQRFQEISHAASILTNATQKRAYDSRLQQPLGGIHFPNAARPGPRPTQRSSGFHEFVLTIYRPRNFVLGSLAIYAFVSMARPRDKPLHTHAAKVQAWKNPSTGQWEQPAPWDPLYRRLKPRLTMVPRELVQTRTR